MKKNEIALSLFNSGYNCAQAVFAAFSEQLKLDKDTALKISCGFGGGMARMQETCGAVTGGIMAIGLLAGTNAKDNDELKDKTYKITTDLMNEFVELHGSLKCSELINCDLKTDEGQLFYKNNQLKEKVCSQCVKSVIKFVECTDY